MPVDKLGRWNALRAFSYAFERRLPLMSKNSAHFHRLQWHLTKPKGGKS